MMRLSLASAACALLAGAVVIFMAVTHPVGAARRAGAATVASSP